MSTEMLDAIDQLNTNANRLIGGVAADQWDIPTPCTEWTVRDLVNHMTGTTIVLASSASRIAPTVAPDSDHLGEHPAAAFAAAAAATQAAWNIDGALEGMTTVPAEMPAVAALGVNIIDIGTHCWDLAEATGQDHGLSPELVALIDDWNRKIVGDDVRAGGGFGEILDGADGEGLDAMLAFVGRRA